MDGGDDDDDDAAREHSVGKSTGSKGPRTRSRGRAEASEALAEADAKKKIDATSTSARSCVLICVFAYGRNNMSTSSMGSLVGTAAAGRWSAFEVCGRRARGVLAVA